MDAFFTGLTKRQAMLLLTAVTFGGQEGVESFDHLADDEADVLRDRARQILAIPRDKRVPFLVQEIKRFITGRRADDLRAADPKRVAEALKRERPAMVEVILRALPASLASDVRMELAQPVVELAREPRPDLLAVIRWKFEEALAEVMPQRPSFSIADLLVMQGRDIVCLADVLGSRALAPLASALPSAEREELLGQLAPDQRQVAVKAMATGAAKRPEPGAARAALVEAARDGEPRKMVRVMGLRRIARACLAQSPEFASRLVEQHRGELGLQLARVVAEERKANRRSDEAVRAEVITELEKLAARGVVERPVRLLPPPLPKAPPPRRMSVDLPEAAPDGRTSPLPPRRVAPPSRPPQRPATPPPVPAAPKVQFGGAAASPHRRQEIPAVGRPSSIQPNPLKGPRKP